MNHSNSANSIIAGVTLTHISDEPPFGALGNEHRGYIDVLMRSYDAAQAAFKRNKFEPERRGARDSRVCKLWLYNDGEEHSPYYTFLVTHSLLERIRAAHSAKGADLSQDELLAICLRANEGAVSPDFTTDAMNAVNASYYASSIAFHPSARLATVYVENEPLNNALGTLIARNLSDSKGNLRIKELASSSITHHWLDIAKGLALGGVTHTEVTLSDFAPLDPPIETRLSSQFLSVKSDIYSLLDGMPVLSEKDRYDALLITYGFDSVWQPEDLCLTRIGAQWYKSVYRVKVADWATRKDELLEAMRRGQALQKAKAKDYDGIFVETAMEPINLSEHPYAQYIEESGSSRINFPGGLIKRVVNAYRAQLKKDGLFIIGDTGDFGFQEDGPHGSGESDRLISGVAARYKVEDYVLAKRILEATYGLSAELMSLDELATKYLPGGWGASVTPEVRQQLAHKVYNGVMLVKRGNSQL